jgi:RimJ/RimL family protein N-acetyltransferase
VSVEGSHPMQPPPKSIPVLETRRLVLRPFEAGDAPVVQRLAGAPEVALATQNIPHPYGDGAAEAWIASHGPAWREGRLLPLAITSARDGLVGTVSLRLTFSHRRGELGYWVGLPFWNHGYATEAAAALVDFGFRELALNRVQARHFTRNPASGRVMQKLGMKFEGIHRQYALVRGAFEDVAMYAVLRSDPGGDPPGEEPPGQEVSPGSS